MKFLTPLQMRTMIEAANSERRDVEFKEAFTWGETKGGWIQECLIRTILGFTNTPSGGTILIGISENDEKLPSIQGLSEEQISSFKNLDAIKDKVDSFSTAPTMFELAQGQYEDQVDSKTLIVISVSPSDGYPAICKKEGNPKFGKLEKGAVYSRSKRGAPATIKVTEVEMAEIIEMAVDKEIVRLRSRGLLAQEHVAPLPTVEAEFAKQVEDWDKI